MNQFSGFFITGTDTEVGKTWVTSALVMALRNRGLEPTAIKPLATGGPAPGEDAKMIAAAAGHEPKVFSCFPVAASPERAALMAKKRIEVDPMLNWIRSHRAPWIVEGVGGWEVPITETIRVSDIAEALQLPVILVAANRLGVLNHTLMSVDAIRGRGLPLTGVVLNQTHHTHQPLNTWNIEDLERHVSAPVVPFPFCQPEQLGQLGSELLHALEVESIIP